MPITTLVNIAASVAALRQIDALDRTDRAITEVADTFHLSPETVAQIAADAAHAQALDELRDQQKARNAAQVERDAAANLAAMRREREALAGA